MAGLPPNADDPSPELRAAEPDVGHFGHYELREQLNSGIGERWRAYDPQRGRVVDLEILDANLKRMAEYFATRACRIRSALMPVSPRPAPGPPCRAP